MAKAAGEKIPLGWAVDENGTPTTDPAEAIKGSLVSTGGYKGWGFGLMVEILAAAVTGSVNSLDVKGLKLPDGPPHDLGQFYFLVDPGTFAGDVFWEKLARLSEAVDALAETGYQQALFDAATALRQPAEFDDAGLASIIFAANRRDVRDRLVANPDLVGETERVGVPIDISMTRYLSGELTGESTAQMPPGFNESHLVLVDAMVEEGIITRAFRWDFFRNVYSQSGEIAGIGPALMGSAYMMLVVLFFSLIFGVAASIYLEEFAPKNRFSDFIEININNLAAVPSIVFGLLGLSIFLNTFGLPRSSPLVGGMVLALMTLPTIIIASRASLRAVPPSIREAALGMGASPVQSTFHHVAPLALPGMFTGAIVGMARALGDTAPLLMIGMVAFIVDVPNSILEPATALPVQIFLWADAPERAFVEKTSAAIIVLLIFLIIMNLVAILLRRRFEKRF